MDNAGNIKIWYIVYTNRTSPFANMMNICTILRVIPTTFDQIGKAEGTILDHNNFEMGMMFLRQDDPPWIIRNNDV